MNLLCTLFFSVRCFGSIFYENKLIRFSNHDCNGWHQDPLDHQGSSFRSCCTNGCYEHGYLGRWYVPLLFCMIYFELTGFKVIFISGFIIWNIDTAICGQLTAVKRTIGMPWSFLLELHGWWHLFTGLGAYICSFTIPSNLSLP